MDLANWPIACLLLITVVVIYVPIVHIRLTNKVIKILEKIEANTQK